MKKGEKVMPTMTLREHYQTFKNQADAAYDIGVSPNQYQLWLCGKFSPCFKSIQKLKAKGISIENFPD